MKNLKTQKYSTLFRIGSYNLSYFAIPKPYERLFSKLFSTQFYFDHNFFVSVVSQFFICINISRIKQHTYTQQKGNKLNLFFTYIESQLISMNYYLRF